MLINFEGTQVGGYTLLGELGRGGMGRVYRATRPGTSQQVAIKIVSSLTTRDEKFERRFWREIAVVSQLEHPSILPVLASGQDDDGTLFMVMPLVEMGTLKDRLMSQGALTPRQASMLAAQIGDALDYAHGKGIIHRDVKPHNIMMLDEDQFVLTDFGVASLASVDETVTNLTSTGATLGTFAYMSPEQIAGGTFDGRADVYSLGVVLYQGLLGRLPFNGDNTATLLSQQLHALPIAPRLINPDFPVAIEMVLEKVLAKKPADRYQTGAELAGALDLALEELPADYVSSVLVTHQQAMEAGALVNQMVRDATSRVEQQPRRFNRLMVLAGLAILLIVAVVGCVAFVLPLQTQVADAQGTAAALGSRTPVIVTQMVTNAAGQTIFIQVTTTPGAETSSTPTLTAAVSVLQPSAQPTATVLPATLPAATPDSGGSSTGGQGGSGAPPPTSVTGGTTTGGTTTGGTAGGSSTGTTNSGGASSSGGGNAGGSSGGGNAGGNSGSATGKGKP